MHNNAECRCRVCALQLERPPWGVDGHTPLFEHCPCCGVEFGYQDATRMGATKFRESWLAAGAKWDVPSAKPHRWDLSIQLKLVPEDYR